MILAQTVLEIYSSGAVGCGVFDRFFSSTSITANRKEVVSDVKSGMVYQDAGMDVRANLGDSGSNRFQDIRLPHFVRTTTTAADGPHDRGVCIKTRKTYTL